MGKVTFDMSVSLDGLITGPDDGVEAPLGRGGERLHECVYDLASWRERHGRTGGTTGTDADVLEEAFATTGAVLMGRRMFDVGEGPWGRPAVPQPGVRPHPRGARAAAKEGGTSFTFVTDGIESGLEQAGAAAGDADVSIAGGSSAPA